MLGSRGAAAERNSVQLMDGNVEDAACSRSLVPRERLCRSGCGRERWAALGVLLLLAVLGTYLLLQHLPAPQSGARTNFTIAQTFSSTCKPRAHLTGSPGMLCHGIHGFFGPGYKAKETSGGRFDLQWEDKNGLAFTRGKINYQNHSLIIPVTGDYFVYSQVSFRGRKSRECEHIRHTLIKHTPSYPQPTHLLTSTKSICNEESPWFVAIYLGAVFHLEKGDRLVVQVSNVMQVDFTREDKTYFGTFLL